jgi:hypothetical protein
MDIKDYKPPLATVEVVQAVLDFGADNLQVAMICDKPVVIERGELEAGELCFYIRPGSRLPKEDWVGDLKRTHNNKIKSIKIRGQRSEGICYSGEILIGRRDFSNMILHNKEFNIAYPIVIVELPNVKNGAGIIIQRFPLTPGTDVTDFLGVEPIKVCTKKPRNWR